MKRNFGRRLKRIFGDYIEDSLNIEIATAPPRDDKKSCSLAGELACVNKTEGLYTHPLFPSDISPYQGKSKTGSIKQTQ